MKQQNTNWYRPKDMQGWTANPKYAKNGEVDRIGLHDCTFFGCKARHSSSAEEYADNKVRASQTSRKTKT